MNGQFFALFYASAFALLDRVWPALPIHRGHHPRRAASSASFIAAGSSDSRSHRPEAMTAKISARPLDHTRMINLSWSDSTDDPSFSHADENRLPIHSESSPAASRVWQ